MSIYQRFVLKSTVNIQTNEKNYFQNQGNFSPYPAKPINLLQPMRIFVYLRLSFPY